MRARAALGSLLFLVVAPGVVAGLVPWLQLVVGGLYRWVRNPMYLAVGAVILGQAVLLGSGVLVAYLVVFGATVLAFVRGYEEPTLAAQFDDYEAYRRTVPGWWPRRPR